MGQQRVHLRRWHRESRHARIRDPTLNHAPQIVRTLLPELPAVHNIRRTLAARAIGAVTTRAPERKRPSPVLRERGATDQNNENQRAPHICNRD
jgi:hypothetical protein